MAARRERWERIVREAEASGLNIRRYCRQHKVSEHMFYQWRYKLQLEAGSKKSKPGFVLVRAAGEVQPETESGALELVLERGWRLRIPRGVDEASLRTVLSALRA